MTRSLVANAADPEQVKQATKKELRHRAQELEDLRAMLTLPAGRRYLWELLTRCKVYESVFTITPERIYYNAGQQDIGHAVLADIAEAQPEALLQMMQEAKAAEEPEKDSRPLDQNI